MACVPMFDLAVLGAVANRVAPFACHGLSRPPAKLFGSLFLISGFWVNPQNTTISPKTQFYLLTKKVISGFANQAALRLVGTCNDGELPGLGLGGYRAIE